MNGDRHGLQHTASSYWSAMNFAPVTPRSFPPQPPMPPEIEGYLKKLKRKTSSLTGGWNKRWFFVDPKRREFGYAKSKTPNAPRSSIYLNDITAIVQFDDTHFQVESRTRNFFLCGESKASTACWVKSLEEYRRKVAEYEKEKATMMAMMGPEMEATKGTSDHDARLAGAMPQKRGSNMDMLQSQRETYSSSSSLASATSSSSASSRGSGKQRSKHRSSERDSRQAKRQPTPTSKRTRDRSRDRSRDHSREDREGSSGDENRSNSRSSPAHRLRAKPRSREVQLDMGEERRTDDIEELAPGAHAQEALRLSSRKHGEVLFEGNGRRGSRSRRSGPQTIGQPMQAWMDDF